MSFILTCPYCKKPFLVDDDREGQIATCQSCGKKIIIQHDDETTVHVDVKKTAPDKDIKTKAMETFRQTFCLDTLNGFSFSKFLRLMFKHHTWEETENYLAAGTPKNTPDISEVDANWPAPWLFARVMLLTVALYLLLIWRADFFNAYMILPMILVGVIGIPLATLLFFWEVNIPRNISILSLGRIILISGFVSIAITLLIHQNFISPEDAIWAGPIEEPAKLLTMMIFFRDKKYRFYLNGLLIGAAVGTGFAIIETGGYVLFYGKKTMEMRAVISPFMHIPWSAMVGFALWRTRGIGLKNQKFISLFLLAIVMHMIWNSQLLSSELTIKVAIFGCIEYFTIIYLIQGGINEIRTIQESGAAPEPEAEKKAI